MPCETLSPLIALPGELRNKIYTLSLTSDTPIVNPYFQPSIQPKHVSHNIVGTALIRSCSALYKEIDIAPLYTSNTFIFTRVAHVHAFREHLSRSQMRWIPSITIDIREAAFSDPSMYGEHEPSNVIANEWLHYLSCRQCRHMPGIWCSRLSTFGEDFPDMKELVVDLTGWQSPFAGLRQSGWGYLQRLLGALTGLRSVTIRGFCLPSEHWNPRPAPWCLGPWFSPVYSRDDRSLLQLLEKCVTGAGSQEIKVFAWHTNDGVASLSVKLVSTRSMGCLQELGPANSVPAEGMAAWEAFMDSRQPSEEAVRAKEIAADSR